MVRMVSNPLASFLSPKSPMEKKVVVVTPASASGIVLRSGEQIGQMRETGRIVAAALALAQSLLRPGVTTRTIDDALAAFYAERGAMPLFKGYPHPHGRAPFPAVTCISVNDEVVHGIPGDRVVTAGDVVSIDTACRWNGWCADAAVTVAVGEITATTRRLLDVTAGVLQLAIDEMRRQTWWSGVAHAMEQYIQAAGFFMVEDFVGHGIGRQMHEPPQVPNYVPQRIKTRDFRLEPGLVIAIEPMVNTGGKAVKMLADDWTVATQDGQNSAHFEHTVAMTGEGPVVLTLP